MRNISLDMPSARRHARILVVSNVYLSEEVVTFLAVHDFSVACVVSKLSSRVEMASALNTDIGAIEAAKEVDEGRHGQDAKVHLPQDAFVLRCSPLPRQLLLSSTSLAHCSSLVHMRIRTSCTMSTSFSGSRTESSSSVKVRLSLLVAAMISLPALRAKL